jgi:hypothetical protein
MKSRQLRLSLVVLLALIASCSGKRNEENLANGGQSSAASAKQDEAAATASSSASAKEIGELADLIAAEAAKLPRTEFDPAALAESLGRNPQAHFQWVRDHTWWAPYRGLLRGPKGVMLDRVGSSLDRALLLGDLLRRAGYSVRLAHAELTESRAAEILDRLRPIPDRRRSPSELKPSSPELKKIVDASFEGDTSLDELAADSMRRRDEARKLASAQSQQVYSAVKDAAAGDGPAKQAITDALQDHWWIERNDGGHWVPMDVLLPDATPGDVVAEATQRLEWNADAEFPAIAESEWHAVELQVVIERYEGNATKELAVLKAVLRPAEVLERPITLAHMPKPWPDMLPNASTDPNALGNAAVSVREWVPFLKVGSDLVAQSGFTDSGDLVEAPFDSQRDIAATGGGGFMSGFGEALGGGESSSSAISAEWLDYEIRVPGSPSQKLRRPLFDLLGPIRRSAGAEGFDASTNERLVERYEALLSSTEIFLQPCDISEEFVAHLMTKSFVANQSAFRELSREQDPDKALKLASSLLERIDRWGPLPGLAYWRSSLGGEPQAWYIDRPNVLNYRFGRPVVNADRVTIREQIDIASNPIAVRAGSATGQFQVRVTQGVTDTIAEMVILGGDPGKTANTSSLFVAAGNEADAGKRIGARDTGAIRELGWPEETAATLAEDIGAGFLAIALAKPVVIDGRERVGWWRVAPHTGETIGVMDTGFHAEEAEYSKLIQMMNALRNFLATNADKIQAARSLPSLTPGQSLLLRAAVAAERALEAFVESRQPF